MSLKQDMIKGVFWTAIGKYSGLIIQILVTAILARLISPEDFGVVAIATVLITFFNMFTDMGLGAAIVQRHDMTKKDYDNLYSFTIYLGLILFFLFFASSFLIARFYGNLNLKPICQLLSISLLFNAFNIVPNALITKEKRFKFIAQRTLILQILSGIVSIISAFCGYGVYALLIAPILSSIGIYIINIKQYNLKFILKPTFSIVNKIFSYSFFLLLFNVSNYFTRNLDKLIVGKYFSLNELGYYEKSYRLMMLPLQQITHVITPVMHPVLTCLQNDYYELAEKYNKIIKLLATIGFPLGIYLYFAADNLILIIYGEQWINAIPVFKILSLSVPIQMLLSTTGAIYQVSNRTDWLFYAGTFHSAITILGLIIASAYFNSINAIAWSIIITFNFHAIISFFVIYKIILKQSLRKMLKLLLIPVLISFCILCILPFIDLFDMNSFISIFIQTIVSGVITIILTQLTGQYDMLSKIRIICNRSIIK